MECVEAARLSRVVRLLVYSLAGAGALVVLGIAFGSLSASAAEPTAASAATGSSGSSGSGLSGSGLSGSGLSGSGLSGSVGSLLGAVTTPVANTVGAATSTVSSVVHPLTASLPAPVRQVVAPATDAVASVARSVSVTQTLAPVTTALDDTIGGVPLVGPALGSTLGSISGATTPVAGLIDSAVDDVGGAAGSAFAPPASPGADSSGADTPGADAPGGSSGEDEPSALSGADEADGSSTTARGDRVLIDAGGDIAGSSLDRECLSPARSFGLSPRANGAAAGESVAREGVDASAVPDVVAVAPGGDIRGCASSADPPGGSAIGVGPDWSGPVLGAGHRIRPPSHDTPPSGIADGRDSTPD
jgi:hypothetical protein